MGLVDDAIAQYGAGATTSNTVDELITQQQGAGITSSSVDNLIAQYGKGAQADTGEGPTGYRTVDNVLWALGLMDRPRNALASGVANLVDDDPETGFWKGAGQGLMGDRQVSWGDVVGIPRGQSTDEWAPWLAKEGAHLAGDVVVDPTNLFFGAGAITKALGLSAKGVSAAGRIAAKGGETLNKLGVRGPIEYLAGSQVGKALFNKAPSPKFETTVNEILREGSRVPIEEEALALDKSLKASKVDQREVFEAMERPGYGSPEVQAIAGQGRKLQEMNRTVFDEEQLVNRQINDLAGKEVFPVKEAIEEPDYLFMPRVKSGRGRWAMDQPGRELMNWINPVTGKVEAQGALGKTKGLTRKIVDGEEQFFFNDVVVKPTQMSHMEVRNFMEKHKTLGPGEKAMNPFIESPAEALYAATVNRQNKVNLKKIILKGMQDGWLTPTTEPMELLKGSLTKGESAFGFLPPRAQERALKIPNMEGFKAPLPVANRLENLYNILEKPDKAIGAIEQLLQAFGKTRIGEMLNSYNTMWKRGMLGTHPGFMFANMVSNVPLMYLGGVRDPRRAIESGQVLAQTGKDAVEGFTNSELFREFLIRGGIDKRAAGLEAGGDVMSVFGEQRIPFSNMITEKLGAVGPYAQKPFDLARQANDFGFKVGGTIENHARVTVALDWLKKNVEGVPSPRDLDAAVAHAKDFLFDYGDLTPMMQGLKQFFPFISWTRSILGRTLKDIGTQPHELANLGRFVDAVFEPPTPEERATMDPWQRSQAPTMGWFGKAYDPTEEGTPTQWNMGRFIPHGTIEQLISRPMQEISGMVAPWMKAAGELPYNKDAFRDRPIDELAGGPVQAMINPLTGGPYQAASQRLLGAEVPSMWQQMVNYTPVSRTLNMANAMARGTVFDDPSQPAMSGWDKAVYLATGGKKYPYDELKLMSRRQREDTKALGAARSKLKLALDKGDTDRAKFYDEQINRLEKERDRARRMVEGGS